MNQPWTVNIEGAFDAAVTRVVRAIPQLNVDVTALHGTSDAMIRFGGQAIPVDVEFKRDVNAATAWQFASRRRPNPVLLVADQTTAEARKILQEHGVPFIDARGNVHMELPGLLIHLEGKPAARSVSELNPPARLNGKAALVAQLLLLHPGREWRVHDIAAEAHVSVGLAHRVLARLDREGVTSSVGSGPGRVRALASPAALLDLWVEENREHPKRTGAFLLAQNPRQLISNLGSNLDQSGELYAITGAAAASVVAPFISAIPVVETWVRATASPSELYTASGATRVDTGQNIVFLQAKDDAPLSFRERNDECWFVNRFRLYLDLLRDPRRGAEQAAHVRREILSL